MKKDIHPKYELCKVHCTCGNTFETRSVQSELRVGICSACHPFYTGKKGKATQAGRIEKFQKKYGTVGSATAQE